ncbi:MAG: sigma 54-interacting transcriptional regulator [Thermoanaerobaculia bacterium]
MTGVSASAPPRHPALLASGGRPLRDAGLSGQQRLAVVLQTAGLLSLLERAGWYPRQRFVDVNVDDRGRLCGVGVAPGRPHVPAQQELRRLLLEAIGGEGRIAGRGQARRAARALAERWDQALISESPDRLVEDILDEAPFLWQARHALARRALVGWVEGIDGPWIAGPRGFRRAVLARVAAGEAAEEILAGPDAEVLWRRRLPPLSWQRLAARGHWREAAEVAEAGAGAAPPSGLDTVRRLYAAGRFRRALERVRGLEGSAAALLRLACQLQLGELQAVRRALPALRLERLDAAQRVELAEVAGRALANLGEPESALPYIERTLAAKSEETALRAHLVAAAAAWDRRDEVAMEDHVRRAAGAERRPELAWRWHNVQALRHQRLGDSAAAVRHLHAALAGSRRRLFPFEAGRLWNELGVARALAGDLAGAERSLRHALHLLGGCDGPGRTTVVLHNLAEIRIRRGRSAGVADLLHRIAEADRQAGNRRGQVQDEALLARWELMSGDAEGAVQRIGGVLAEMERQGLDWHRDELQVLAARGLGWLGRADEAAHMLERAGAEALHHLEAEERPTVLALAGRPREAVRGAVPDDAFEPLWQALLAGRAAEPEAWNRAAAACDAYRIARFAVDAESISPGWLPESQREAARETLRRLALPRLADRLASGAAGAWGSLARYLASDEVPLAQLFSEAGYPEARLVKVDEEELEILVDGRGGGVELSAPCGDGVLELYHSAPDETLRALLLVIAERLALRRPAYRPRQERRASGPADDETILGESPDLLAALARADRLAALSVPILVLGATGTGKELVARRIHERSSRADGPFVPINCAGLSETLLQSELFGHVRGAFTGADRDRLGVFETARGGTVFLDEIGDLPASAQKVLLRVLQEGEVRRLGESTPRRVDVRVVAATHRDLEAMVAERSFRADLFYRLAVGRVELPPLAARGRDVLLLAEHFLAQAGDGRTLRPSAAARRCLQEHPWPGNVRQLRAVLLQAAALCDGEVIEPEHLELPGEVAEPMGDYHAQIDTLRRRLVRETLEACDGNQAAAARRLGLTRQALNYQVRKLGL